MSGLAWLAKHARLTSWYELNGEKVGTWSPNAVYVRQCECGHRMVTDIAVFTHHYELLKESK